MLWSRIPRRIALVLGLGVAATLPAAAQQTVPAHVPATISDASMSEPAVGRVVLPASWHSEGLLTVSSPVSQPARGGPRLQPVVHPVAVPLDRRDDASGAAAAGSHTIVFSTLGLIVVVAIIAILLVK